jgi:hypothetical protein
MIRALIAFAVISQGSDNSECYAEFLEVCQNAHRGLPGFVDNPAEEPHHCQKRLRSSASASEPAEDEEHWHATGRRIVYFGPSHTNERGFSVSPGCRGRSIGPCGGDSKFTVEVEAVDPEGNTELHMVTEVERNMFQLVLPKLGWAVASASSKGCENAQTSHGENNESDSGAQRLFSPEAHAAALEVDEDSTVSCEEPWSLVGSRVIYHGPSNTNKRGFSVSPGSRATVIGACACNSIFTLSVEAVNSEGQIELHKFTGVPRPYFEPFIPEFGAL